MGDRFGLRVALAVCTLAIATSCGGSDDETGGATGGSGGATGGSGGSAAGSGGNAGSSGGSAGAAGASGAQRRGRSRNGRYVNVSRRM
jgi:hypothetical protein